MRFNGATDLNWVAVIKAYPDTQFVDYTKSERARSPTQRASCPPITTSRSLTPAITPATASAC